MKLKINGKNVQMDDSDMKIAREHATVILDKVYDYSIEVAHRPSYYFAFVAAMNQVGKETTENFSPEYLEIVFDHLIPQQNQNKIELEELLKESFGN